MYIAQTYTLPSALDFQNQTILQFWVKSIDMTQTGNAHAATAAEILESGRLEWIMTHIWLKLEATATPTSAKQKTLDIPTNVPAAPAQHLAQKVWDRKAKSNHNSSTHVSPVGNTAQEQNFSISSPHFQHGLYGHTQRVCCIAGAADRPVVITGSWDWTARVWFLDTFNNDHSKHAHGHRKNRHAGSVLAVALTPDGKIAITGKSDTNRSTAPAIIDRESAWIHSVAISANGSTLISEVKTQVNYHATKKAEAAAPIANFGRVRNNLRMGVVGLPNGQVVAFNVLTSQSAPAENFPFCTIDPNEARCPVPDERYDFLCSLWNPPSTQPAYLHVTDIAGLIKGASEGAVLETHSCPYPSGRWHFPCSQVAEDLAVHKSGGKFKLSATFIGLIEKLYKLLESNTPVRSGEWSTTEVELINDKMSLITTKPIVYLINMSKTDFLRKKNKWLLKIKTWIDGHGGSVMIPFSVEFEQQWSALAPEERSAFIEENGPGAVSTLPKMITTGYKELNLIYFYLGEKSACMDRIQGRLGSDAASVIHTDFGKAFIKAEVVSYADYKELCKTALFKMVILSTSKSLLTVCSWSFSSASSTCTATAASPILKASLDHDMSSDIIAEAL
ncbi:obg-like ATPase 1 [Batrachochytrium salamandrivorans]|nr:obg-like ATPase 1 [Batrachochytrium salamandrivorans]